MSEAAGDHAKGVIGPGVLQEKTRYKPLIHWIRLFWTDTDPPGPYDIGRLSFHAVSQNCLPAGGALLPIGGFRSGTILILPIAAQALQAIPRRNGQRIHFSDPVDLIQFSPGDRPQRLRTTFSRFARIFAIKYVFSAPITKRPYHGACYNDSHYSCQVVFGSIVLGTMQEKVDELRKRMQREADDGVIRSEWRNSEIIR
ncbi:hypothetical protein [Desulfatirhabdium butyrativorans]|uniref:hypothetical protein n=1 Tax=Desulfatirhabdium butyrativorans TaxID=340467 RepID=UPI00146FB953|nr:hypothetical protein [Desulfatirhabdium butyrativorans]